MLAWRSAPAVLIGAMAACGVFLAALAAAPGFDPALGLAVLAGAADGPILAATLAVRQRTVPADRYAQTAATAASLKTGAYALGAAAAGLLAGALTARELVLGGRNRAAPRAVPFLGRQARSTSRYARMAVRERHGPPAGPETIGLKHQGELAFSGSDCWTYCDPALRRERL